MMSEKRELIVVHKDKRVVINERIESVDLDITETFAEELDEIIDLISPREKEARNRLMKIVNALRDPDNQYRVGDT